MSLDQETFGRRSPAFWVVVDRTSRPPCVRVTGDIDLASCAAFRHALQEAAAESRTIVLDLAEVTFMGSVGLREIAGLLDRVETIEIRSPSSVVERVLALTDLGDRVVVATT